MNAPFKELSPALQKLLVSCSLLFDTNVSMLDQLSKISANWQQLDKLSKRSLIKYLQNHFYDLKLNPYKSIDSLDILVNCGVQWSYLTSAAQKNLLASLNNGSRLDGPQLRRWITLLVAFGVRWSDLNIGLKQKLLLNMSQNNTFNIDNAADFVHLLGELCKMEVPRSSFLVRRIQTALSMCFKGIRRHHELVLPFLNALTHWEMSLGLFDEEVGTYIQKVVNYNVRNITNLEVRYTVQCS